MNATTASALKRASQHLQAGEYVLAARIVQEILRDDRDNTQAWYLLSFALNRPADQQRAIQEAFRTSPDSERVRARMAELGVSASGAVVARLEQDDAAPKVYERQTKGHRFNSPLFFGVLIIGLILLVAYIGPDFAPRDPMEQHTIVKVGDQWYTPPIDVLTPTFPLGSDEHGRDILSRLIFAIRPTLEMVLLVAATRLLLGTFIGMVAGWSRNAIGNVFDALISAALAIPVLIVALGGIAAVGIELGVLAFIIALSLTGWVETARIVRDQTETIRGQQYVEAAFALGSPTLTMIRKHVFPQILAIIWILFAFELSGTLMVTAALGFLGYYIGGDIWTPGAGDSVAQAISGAPELGQMLATAGGRVTQPWGLIAVGSVVFLTVLGFNMLGEGLRRRNNLLEGRRKSAVGERMAAFTLWVDEHFLYPLGNFWRHPVTQTTVRVAMTVAAISVVAWYWLENRPRPFMTSPLHTETMPLWGNAHSDPYGTYWTSVYGPDSDETAWDFYAPAGFTGGPVLTPQGGVLITSENGTVYGLAPDGSVVTEFRLPDVPVGTPAVGEDLTLYFTHLDGGASAYAPDGELRWRYAPTEDSYLATSGPVLDQAGNLYYVAGSAIRSLTPDGELRWNTPALNGTSDSPVILSPDGQYVSLWNAILSAETGELLDRSASEYSNGYFSGADGRFFQWDANDFYTWTLEEGPAPEASYSWGDAANYTLSGPNTAGALPNGTMWVFYDTFSPSRNLGTDTRVIWLDESSSLINNINYPTRGSQVIGVDQDGTLYACGNLDGGYGLVDCQAFDPDEPAPRWTTSLPRGRSVIGGAIAPQRLYVATAEGYLYAIGAGSQLGELDLQPASQATTSADGDDANAADHHPDYLGPTYDEIDWTLIVDLGTDLTNGPVSDSEGGFYLTIGNQLHHYSLDGALLSTLEFETRLVGDLLADADGRIYLVDNMAAIHVVEDDAVVATYAGPAGYEGRSGALQDATGNLYINVSRGGANFIQKFAPDGAQLWLSQLDTFNVTSAPTVSADGSYLFMNDEIYAIEDGTRLEYDFGFLVQYFVAGENGRSYLVTQGSIVPITLTPEGVVLNEDRLVIEGTPPNMRVLANGDFLLYYNSGASLFSYNGEMIGGAGAETFNARLVGLENDRTIYTCGRNRSDFRQATHLNCAATNLIDESVNWSVQVGESGGGTDLDVANAFIHDHQIIVGTESGLIYRVFSIEPSAADAIPASFEPVTLLDSSERFTGAMGIYDDRLLAVNSQADQTLLVDLDTVTYQAFDLPERPVGAPAFSSEGDIYITLTNGDLLKLSPEGETIWQFTPSLVGGGLVGPRVAENGNVYYMVQRSNNGIIVAVSDNGVKLWSSQVQTGKIYNPLSIHPSGDYLFFLNEIYDAHTGEQVPVDFADRIRHFFVDVDGLIYYLSENSIYEVIVSPSGVTISENGASTETTDSGFTAGVREGAVLPDGTIWFHLWNSGPPLYYDISGAPLLDYQPQYPWPFTTIEGRELNPLVNGMRISINIDEGIITVVNSQTIIGPATLVE